jgi:transposase InsO family protein
MMAVRLRRPRKAVIHSDQGSQYGSDEWRRFCLANRLEPSMSRRGNCYDNAVAESFFSSLKKESRSAFIKTELWRRLTFTITLSASTIPLDVTATSVALARMSSS